MEKIEKLTKEQEARFPEFVKKWTEIGLCTKPANRKEAEEGIRMAYAAAGLKEPKIVWTTSPLASGLTRAIVQKHKDDIGAAVKASVWASVRDSVWASVRDSVRASVGASGYGQHDANWIGFYNYFDEVLGLREQVSKLDGIKKITENSGWFLAHENICWISERHTVLRTDDRGRLHCEDGPALEYPDGWGIYSWHGTKIPEEWIKDKGNLKAETVLKTANMEQRRAGVEILGWAKILKDLKSKTIDEDKDPKIGKLVEVSLPDAPKERFLIVLCGTGREFALRVTNFKYDTARECNAATYGWTKGKPIENYIPTIRT